MKGTGELDSIANVAMRPGRQDFARDFPTSVRPCPRGRRQPAAKTGLQWTRWDKSSAPPTRPGPACTFVFLSCNGRDLVDFFATSRNPNFTISKVQTHTRKTYSFACERESLCIIFTLDVERNKRSLIIFFVWNGGWEIDSIWIGCCGVVVGDLEGI